MDMEMMIDNAFAEFIMLNNNQFKQHSLTFKREGLYIIIKNHKTNNILDCQQ